jgi:hypothetical protein
MRRIDVPSTTTLSPSTVRIMNFPDCIGTDQSTASKALLQQLLSTPRTTLMTNLLGVVQSEECGLQSTSPFCSPPCAWIGIVLPVTQKRQQN